VARRGFEEFGYAKKTMEARPGVDQNFHTASRAARKRDGFRACYGGVSSWLRSPSDLFHGAEIYLGLFVKVSPD
jgi:hypothetical protein